MEHIFTKFCYKIVAVLFLTNAFYYATLLRIIDITMGSVKC